MVVGQRNCRFSQNSKFVQNIKLGHSCQSESRFYDTL